MVFAVSIVGAETGCPDQNITLTAVVDGPVNASVTYLWKIDGEAAPGTNNQQIYQFKPGNIDVFADGLSHEFTVEVSPANCSMVASPVHPFVMMDIPTITLTGPAYTCASMNSYELVVNITPVDGSELDGAQPAQPAYWQWFYGEDRDNLTLFATTTENTLTVSEDNLRNNWSVKAYYGIGTNMNEGEFIGVNAAACATEPTDTIDFSGIPALEPEGDLTLALAEGTVNPICAGMQITLNVTNTLQFPEVSVELGTPSYEWYMDGQLLATTTAPVNADGVAAGDITLTTTALEGTHFFYVKAIYPNYECTLLQTDPVSVTGETAPALTIVGNNVICDGTTENILTAVPDDLAEYAWTKPAETPGVEGAFRVNGIAPGTYNVTATTASGCVATADFTVYQFGGDLQISASEYNVCPGSTVVLNANYQGWTNTNITYAWKQPGDNDYTAGGSTLVVTAPTTVPDGGHVTYYVKATVDGCEIETSIVVNIITPTDVTLTVTTSGDVCVGGQVTATATPGEGQEYTGLYDWYVNGIQVPGEHADIITMNFDQAGQYTFAATPANTVCADINLSEVGEGNTVTVYDIPQITITGNNVICQNATATLTATEIEGATYSWTGPVGFTPATTQPETAEGTATENRVQTTTIPGVYAVTASLNGCQTTAEFTVEQLGGDLQVYASQQDVCPGTSVMLNANLDGFGNENISYLWSSAANYQHVPTVVVTPQETTTYTVTASATNADGTQGCQITSAITVNVLTPGTNNLTVEKILPENDTVCVGYIAQYKTVLKSNIDNVETSEDYDGLVTWFVNGVEVPGQNMPTLVMNMMNPGMYAFAAQPAYDPCNVMTPNASEDTVIVYAAPEIVITGNNVICDGASTTLTATVIPNGGNPEVNWVGPVSSEEASEELTTSTPGVYTATATNDYGCTATADFTVYQVGGTVTLTADKMEICAGESVALTVNTTGYENENVTYAWSVAGETGSSILVTPTATTGYTVTVSVGDGVCSMTDTITITVHELPANVVATRMTDTIICAGGQATFQALPAAADLTYVWFQNGVVIPGNNLNAITVNLNDAGTYAYSVLAVNQYGCMSNSVPVTNASIPGEGTYTPETSYTPVSGTLYQHGEGQYLIYQNGDVLFFGYVNPFNASLYVENNEDPVESVPVSLEVNISSLPAAVVTVQDAPQVVITGNNVICNGASTTLTAMVTPAADEETAEEGDNDNEGEETVPTYTYLWTGPVTGDVDGLKLVATEPGVYNFNVTSNVSGCTANAQFTVSQFGADIQVTASAQDVCPGTSVMLNANLDGYSNEDIVYVWTVVDGDALGTGSTKTVTPEETTSYAVNAHTTAYPTCQMKDTITVNVINEVAPTLTVTVTSDEYICEGGMVNATIGTKLNNESVDSTQYFYTWYVNGIAVEGENMPTITMMLNEVGNYTFAAKVNGFVCISPIPVPATKVVKVVATPEFTLTGNNIICNNGATATITASPYDAENPIYTYTWSDGNTYDGNDDNVFMTQTAGTYSVTATSENGACTSVQTFQIYTNGADLIVNADKMEVCAGEMVVLSADYDGFVTENVTYTWNGTGIVGSADGTATGSTISAIPTANGHIYTVSATTGTGDNVCTITGTINITVHPTPATPTFTYTEGTDICAGDQKTFTVDHVTENGYASFVWYLDGVEIPGENLSSLTFHFNEAGTYTVRVKALSQYGCASAVSVDNAQIHVLAAPEFTLTGNNIICNGATATITAIPDSYTYQWQGHSGSGNSHTYDVAGTYSVTASNGTCTATQTFNVYTNGADLQVTADKMEVCEGDMVVLNANLDGFINDNIQYTWTGTGLISNTTGATVTSATGSTVAAIPTADNHTYTVVATTTGPNADANAGCSMTGNINITVHALPAAVTATTADADICAGGQATITALPAATDLYYIWFQNGVQIPGNNLNTITVNLNDAGTYNYSAVAVNQYGCFSAGSDVTTTSTIETTGTYTPDGVYTPVAIQLYQVTGTTQQIVLFDGHWGFVPANVYGEYNTPVYTFDPNAEGEPVTVELLVNVNTLAPAVVNVHAAPDFTLTGNNIICNGATATIDATSNTEDTYEYTWSNGQTGATFTTTTAGTYAVTATDGTCTSVQTFNIYTNGSDLQVYADKMEVCAGEMVVLNANLDGFTNDNISYAWTGAGLVSNTGSTVSAIPTLANHTYTVVASTTGTNAGCTMTGHLNITVHPLPAPIDLYVSNNTICEGGQVVLDADGNADSYIWYQNGVEIPGLNQHTVIVNLNEEGVYAFTVKGVSEYGCVSANASAPEFVHVVMQPTVQITGDPMICHNNLVTLYANLNDTDASLDYTYEWRLYNYTVGGNEMTIPGNWFIPSTQVTIPDFPGFMEGYPIWVLNGDDAFVSTPLPAQDYPYIFTVVVTTPEGCRVESEPYYVYVGEDPEVVVTVDYNQVCPEGEITATAHLGNWNMDNLTAQWQVRTYDADNDTWSAWTDINYGTSGILHHTPGVTSEYRIIVTQTTTGCVAYSDPVQVEVVYPTVITSVVAINGNVDFPTDNVCEGAQLIVTAYMQHEVPVLDENGEPTYDEDGNPITTIEDYINEDVTYMWTLNGMELQTVHGPQFSAQAYIYDNDPVDYVYAAYAVYDIPGCEIVPVASNTVHVKRNPIVTIDGNPNVCYFGPNDVNVILTAWVDGFADPDATYTWYESGQYRENTAGWDNNYAEKMVPTYDNPYIYTVEVTNGDGCTSISDPFTVNVYLRPYAHITGDANAICNGGEVTLQANLENYNDPMLVYQWFKNSTDNVDRILGATHEIQTFAPTESTDYIVMVSHLMDVNTEYCVAYDTFHVDVNDIPEVYAEFTDLDATSICEGRSFTIGANVVNGGVAGGEVYTWYRNGIVMEGFHQDHITDAPVAIDGEPTEYVYAVSVKQSASGCESEIFTLDPITVNPNPTLELVTDPIVCVAEVDNVVLHANVQPEPATEVQYMWMEDNLVVDITPENTYAFTKPYRDYPYNFSVELVNDYGCVSHADAQVYVNAAPVVNITATETNICVGGEITLSATLADWNADQLTFQWLDGNDSIAGATELSYTVVPTAGPHAYHVAIKQLTSECEATSNVIDVMVNADPVVTSISNNIPAENAVCDGFQVELTANINGGVAGGEVYTWYRNGEIIDGAVAAVFTEILSAQNNEPTQYTYAVEVAQAAAGCASTVVPMNAFTVNPNPTIQLVTDPIVCAEGEHNVVLYANVEPAPATAIEYKWLEDNHVFATTTDSTIALTKPYRDYPYSFAVQIVNEYACTATSEAQVYVNANPVVNTTVTENNICVGGEITMTLNLNDWNADQLTYQWFDNGDSIYGATSLSYTVVPAEGTHEYFVKVYQLTSGCVAESTPFTVTVNPDPVIASVTVADNLYNVCNGAQLVITATPEDGNVEGEVYTWYRNGILIPGATAATIMDTPGTVDNNIQHYVYTAVVTRPQAGCTSLPVSSADVTVYPNPVVVITGDQHVCETDSVFLIANVDTTAFPVGNLHFTWYESGQIRDNQAYGLGDSRFYAEYMYPRTEPYIYTVNVERTDVEHACASMSAEFYVYVYPQPVVNVTASETMICEGGQVTLTANLADYNAENLIYQWYEIKYQDVVTPTGYNANHTYSYDTVTVPYRDYIPGATMPTFTTTLDSTTTLGVVVFQTNSTCWANDEVTITVNEIPVITSVLVNGAASDTVCDGAQVTVTATYDANGSVGEPTFTWYRNGVLMEGVTGPIFSENVYTTDNHVTYNYYSVIVTLPASGCTSEMSEMAAALRINPAPSTVSISGINVLCENDSTTLTAYSDVEGEWTWSTGSHANTITVPAGVYTVTLKTVEGCEMTSEPFTVEAFGTDLLVSASATSICRGEHTTLYVNQDGWQGNVTYLWDAQAGNSTATTVDVQPDSTTTYHVTATVSSTNGSCTAEGEVTIIVNQLPAAFEVIASTHQICEGNQITFTAPVDPQVTGYIWYQNGVEIPGENQNAITINFNEAGDYTFAAKAISVEGCVSAEASEPVTITVTPAPAQVTITGVNVLCENSTTTLTAQSDVPGIFVWSTGDTATTVTVPAGSYNVTIFTAEGCQLTSENFNVTALGTDLLVSASATAICEGEHTTLYVDQDGWQGNVTYLWSTGDSATTVDVQPAVTTTYTVTATVSSTNGTCTAEGEVTIVVTPRPAQVTVTANKTTICEGNQITFNASGDAYAYIWYQNGVEIPGENQATLTVNFNEAGNYTFAAKAINDQNCESALASEPVTVTVNPAPAQVTITGVNVLCENSTTTLTAQSDVTGIFVWSTGDTATTVTVPAGSYNVTMITPEGCQLTSENFNVTAFGTDLLVSASATAICQGEHTTLYVDQDGWQGNVTYLWSTGDSATTLDVQPAMTTTYTVTATVNSTNGSCTAQGEVTIVVTPRPAQVTVAANKTTICEGNQITFTASGDAYSYIWYQNGVEIPGENQATLTVNFNEAGSYTFAAKAVNDQNCESALASEPVTVTVNPAPAQVTITGVNVLCENTMTTLTAQSDVTGIFVWSTGDTATTVTVPAGSYNVTMITPEGCQLTSENFNVTAFGTDLLVSASATAICQGEHTTLYVDQDGWQGNVTYLWSTGDSATTLDVQPAETTTYHVTATVASTNGTCNAEGVVTIIVNPLPVVAAVTATETVVCEGTQVTFTATGDENTTAYIWYNNGVEIAGENQATLTVNFNEAGDYHYAVKAISNEGCVSAIAVNAPVVTVNAAPESVTISGNTAICDGGFTTLYANVVPNETATYEWYMNNVAMNTNTESIVVTTAGSYKVVASFNGCSTESDAVVVTVEQAPQLQLTATETTICAGGTTTITAEATGWNNANVNYNWSNDFQGSEYTFTPAVAGTYTFTVTASQATSGCTANDEITITVNEVPATPVVTVDNAVVCDGGQVMLTVTNANADATYTWFSNGVVIPGATTATLTQSPVTVDGDATNYVYTVYAELPISGCTSATSANTVVTVIPTPVVAVSVEGNTTLCAGGSTTLHANVTPANANYNYQWYKDNVLIEGATTADYTAAEVARETAYNYSVVVTANAGCNVTAYAPAITFVADPVVAATISNNISCVGGTATLTAIVDGGVANVNGLNGYTFEWYRNTPTTGSEYSTTEFVASGAVITTPATDAPGNYTYWVTVTSNYGCQSTSETVNYSVIADPVVTIAVATGYPQTVCNGGESMLKANVSGGYGETSYQWYKNGNLLVGETNQTLAIDNLTNGVNDVYMVEVAQTGVGCANSASAYLNTLVTVAPDYTVNITGFGNVCEGGTLTLNAAVNGVLNGDVLSYQWYRVSNGAATAIYGANAAQYETSELLLGDSYEYYVVVTSNISGCSVVSNSVPASVVAAPSVAIQGANTVCEGGDLTLNAFVTGGVEGAAYTYTWTWTGAANGSATTAVPTFVPTVAANDLATPYYFTVTISRNDNTGCTATSVAHEVNVLAVPTVSITADNNYICQNGDVTFTAHVTPVGAYNYVWTINGQQQAVNAATVTTTLATTGTINASVVVSAANASGSCSASATIAAPVQVVAAPTVTLAANHTTMCVGGVTTLTATVNANNNIPANFNYEWIVDGAPISGVTSTLNQTLTTAGVHTYQVRVSQDNNLGCSSAWSNQATVQVAEQPVVTLTSEDGLAICEGGSITLTGVVTNYGNTVNGVTNSDIYGSLVFDWTSNGVNVHHNTSNNAMNQVTETLNNIGNYTYQVAVTPAGYNCQPQVSNEYTVNVVNNPTWTDVHVYSNNGTDACLGEMVYLMAGIEGGALDAIGITGGHIQWVVTDENGNTVDVNGGLGGNSYDIPTVAGTYIYTPTFVGNIGSGCQLANTNDVEVAVTVHELPTAEFISGDGTALCANDASASAELVISFTGVAPFTYEVVDGAGNIIAHATTMANTATIYVSPDHQTTYRINLISDNYCENPAVGDATVVTVYVNEIQFADNTFSADCDNNEVTISFNMISGNPAANFTVVYENGLQASGTINNNTATFPTPSVAGSYSAVFTVDGCSYDIIVNVPMASYSYTGTLPLMDQRWNDVVVVNCNPETNGGHVFVGFQWYHNGVAIPGAIYSNYQDKAGLNGFYSVELTEQDADGNMITYMACEQYFSGASSVKVYPVPANVRQEITIELDLTSEELDGAVLDIYSVTGAHISHVTDLQPITKIEGFKAQGTYFGRILTGTNDIKTVKFIIVK